MVTRAETGEDQTLRVVVESDGWLGWYATVWSGRREMSSTVAWWWTRNGAVVQCRRNYGRQVLSHIEERPVS